MKLVKIKNTKYVDNGEKLKVNDVVKIEGRKELSVIHYIPESGGDYVYCIYNHGTEVFRTETDTYKRMGIFGIHYTFINEDLEKEND